MKKLLLPLLLLPALAASGQTLCVLGDSYVANHHEPRELTWHCKMASRLGLTYLNYGRNGSCVAFDRSHDGPNNFGPAMWQRCGELDPQADYVLIIAGHNDADKCGLNADSLAMFADSLDCLLTSVASHCPKARIGYVTPWYVDRPGFAPVCAIIREACERHGVPLLWNYSEDCVVKVRDAEFRRLYFQSPDDTAHLNEAGHELFLPVAESWFVSEMLSPGRP